MNITIKSDHQAAGEPVNAPDAVEIRGVTKNYGTVCALSSIDLNIRKGEFFSLLGPSGCGKSTTLALIGGFEMPTSGALRIAGHDVANVPSYRRPVNTVFQSYALFPHMTIGDNVAFGLKMKGLPAAKRRTAVSEILDLVSLGGMEGRRPAQLSGGQRQRVALARALVNQPSVLLLDEPLGALDLKLRKQMQTELTNLQRKVGITFVYVTHDQEEALTMSDRIAVMDHGKVLQVGTPTEIYDTPSHRFVMEFMGSPNALSGRVSQVSGQSMMVELEGIGAMPARSDAAISEGEAVSLLVRPERIRVSRNKPVEGHFFEATLSRLNKVGFVAHCHVQHASGHELVAYRLSDGMTSTSDAVNDGDAVYVTWSDADASVFAN
ncbi:ABC transporter ATP-binding protein [Hoeflea sp. WL0058]|uniref:Spermidine/putrescine import ATP-binding protein PotA n=1 Tax=Flavimaribacter sediminis TaxID=2865987 RepID=A0AAE3D0U0_9HYPH|nr:ABC transporter ATP-binding protein [Flavimaribacter sediminis]MBW8638109.1 ABC transporter ATP-binding protein [Flavimaribacter sediminis]